jgi:hypothetical protein
MCVATQFEAAHTLTAEQIGRECARLSRAFGARVVVADSFGKRKA